MSTAFEIPQWLLSAPQPPAPPADDHRIEGMVNHFIAGKQEALFTAPDAFYRLEGTDAIQGQPGINDRLQALRAATLDLARDDGERAALGPRLDLHIDDAADGIDRHVAEQRRVYQRQVVSQRQALIQRAAELEHDNDDKILGLAEANATAAGEGARMDGIAADSPEEAAAIVGARSDILRRAIDERIANRKGLQALALFDQVKDQLAPEDRRVLELPVQATRLDQAANQWIARETKTDGPPLQDRLDADPDLPSDAKPIIRAKLDARDSADESARIAKVQGLDDEVREAFRILPINPGAYRPGTFARLADAYDAAGAPERAQQARRVAARESFLIQFAQASVRKQQQMYDELPEGESDLRNRASAIQDYQDQAFVDDAFGAGTTLYEHVGPPLPFDDIEGRIRQARQIAQLRGGIAVVPYTLREIDDMRRTFATRSEQDKQAVHVDLEGMPVDVRPSIESLDETAPTDLNGLNALLRTHPQPAERADGPSATSPLSDQSGSPADEPVVTAQAFPPTVFPGRVPPFLPRPAPPPGTVPTPRGMTPHEQLPRGSSDGNRAGKPFLDGDPYPEGTPCTYCGKPTTNEPGLPNTLERDHIIPRSRGGNGDRTNEAPSCRTCNREKGRRTPEEWYIHKWRWEEASAMPDNLTKIRFNLDPKDWHGIPAELLWAEPIGPKESRVFRLLNSPYYARGVSYLDIVRAEDAPDGMGLDYAGTVEPSGHSTVWLLTAPDSAEFERHLERLHSKGATHEATMHGPRKTLYSVDVPPETDFDEILSILDEGDRAGAWQWQVPHEAGASSPSSTPTGTA